MAYVLDQVAPNVADKQRAHVLDDVLSSYGYAYPRIRGKSPLDLNDLETLAEHLGMTPIDLLRRAQAAGDQSGPPAADRAALEAAQEIRAGRSIRKRGAVGSP